MSDTPPFQFTEEICSDPEELANLLNRILSEVYRIKQDKDETPDG